MASSKKRMGIFAIVRREMRGLLTLTPWVLVSILLVALLGGADLGATAGLFQSSPPTETMTPVPTATSEIVPPAPTDTPPVEGTVTEVPTMTAIPPATPVPDTPVPSAVPTELSPTPTETLTLTAVPATMTPVPSPSPTPEQDRDRYSEGESELRFDWTMLFDSAALALTYVWLCCGILVLVGIPVLFVVLWAASKRRQQSGE